MNGTCTWDPELNDIDTDDVKSDEESESSSTPLFPDNNNNNNNNNNNSKNTKKRNRSEMKSTDLLQFARFNTVASPNKKSKPNN